MHKSTNIHAILNEQTKETKVHLYHAIRLQMNKFSEKTKKKKQQKIINPYTRQIFAAILSRY